MTLPVIYSAAKANPQDSFTVLTQAFMMPVFMNRPSNLEVIGISTKGAEKTLLGLLRFTSALVKFDYDIVLDLQDVIRTWIICAAFRMKGKPVYVLDKIRKKYPPLMRRENKKLEPLRPLSSGMPTCSVRQDWPIPNLLLLYMSRARQICRKWKLLPESRPGNG